MQVDPKALTDYCQTNYALYYPNPSSRCSEFVRAVAADVFICSDLVGKDANSIFDYLRENDGFTWSPLYDEKLGKTDLIESFRIAQEHSNEGHFIIAAWRDNAPTAPHGHVAIIVPGTLETSTDWKSPTTAILPQIAQAGRQTTLQELEKGVPANFYTFAKRKLSYGFTYDMKGPVFTIYEKK